LPGVGGRASGFLGGLLVAQFRLAAMSRADMPEARRRDFMLYVDEFQNYASSSFIDILSEARKYRLCLTIANQFAEGQLPQEMIHALCGNVGTMVSFQVGANDAEFLVQQLGGGLTVQDFLSLPRYRCYVRTEVGGEATPPFSVRTLPPPEIAIEEEIRRLHPGVHPRKLVRREVQKVRKHSARHMRRDGSLSRRQYRIDWSLRTFGNVANEGCSSEANIAIVARLSTGSITSI
jgi:hypothetical protein